MPLRSNRRIFRGGSFAAPGRSTRVLVRRVLTVAVLVVAFGGGAMLVGRFGRPAGRLPAPAGAVQAEPQQVAVVDGDTLRLRDMVVRLRGVDAPARGHNCADGSGGGYDCGAAASSALADLVRNRAVACRLTGRDRAGLAQGSCEAGGTELNQALVAAGWARGQTPELSRAEDAARAAHRGLWRNGANPGF